MIDPICAIKRFQLDNQTVQYSRRNTASSYELALNLRSESGIEGVSKISIRPIQKAILDSVESRNKVRDMIFIRHVESMKFSFGGAFGIFESPAMMKFIFEVVPGGKPRRTTVIREEEEV
jgi:hypothetical protein